MIEKTAPRPKSFNWRTEFSRYSKYLLDIREIAHRKAFRSFSNLTLTLFTISFFIVFAIKPTLVIIASLVREIKDKEEISLRLRKKVASLVKAQEVYSLNQDRFYLVDQALPEKPDFPPLLFFVEKLASESGVQLLGITINKVDLSESDKPVKKNSYEFDFAVQGEYPNLLRFLESVDRSRRVLTKTKVSFFQNTKAKEVLTSLRLTLSGNAEFLPKVTGGGTK